MAHADLVYPGFLKGGERVRVTGMHPNQDLYFDIPLVKLGSSLTVRGRTETPRFDIETVIIEPIELRFSMVWKAALRCDKKALSITDIAVTLAD